MRILLVEDNPGDVRLTEEAFKDCNIQVDLDVVSDGEQAIRYLNRIEPYQNSKLPDLVLLDLNLTKINGA